MSVIVTVVGNLTRDPELRFTQGGFAVANTAVAVNERKLVNGQWEDGETTFINVVAWRELGENASASLHKGDRVVVTGKLQVRKWEKEDGTSGTSVEIQADDIGPSLRFATTEVSRTHRTTVTAGAPGAVVSQGAEEPF